VAPGGGASRAELDLTFTLRRFTAGERAIEKAIEKKEKKISGLGRRRVVARRRSSSRGIVPRA
jgi:hypothetical protein